MARKRWLSITFLVLGILALVLIAAAIIVRISLAEIIVAQIEKRLEDVDVEIGSAWFSFPGTIGIKGATVRRKHDNSLVAEINRADITLNLRAKSIRTIVVKGINLKLRQADLEMLGPQKDPMSFSVWMRGVSAELAAGQGEIDAPRLQITEGNVSLEPEPHGLMKLNGTGRSSAFGYFRVNGQIGGKTFGNNLEINIEQAKLDEQMAELIPAEASESWLSLNPTGTVSLRASINWRPTVAENTPASREIRWSLQLRNASVRPPDFPSPFTNINASIEGTEKTISVRSASASYGQMKLAFDSTGSLRDDVFRMLVRGRVRDFEPKPEFLALLTNEGRRVLQDLRLKGQADADIDASLYYKLNPNPGEHTFDVDYLYADVNLRNGSVNTVWFPYSIDGFSGSFIMGLDEMLITSPLVGTHANGTVSLTGRFKLSGKGAPTDMRVELKNLPVDEDFFNAVEVVDAGTRRTLDDFEAKGGMVSGAFSHHGSFERDAGRWSVELDLAGVNACYKDFPYALSGISGKITIKPGKVTIEDFSAWHGTGTVSASGWINPLDEQNNIFLKIKGTNLSLDEDLNAALPKEMQEIWSSFNPIGKIDAEVTIASPTRSEADNDIRIAAVLRDVSASVPVGDKWMALTQITGNVEHYGNITKLSGIKARAAGGIINLDGSFIQAKDRWVAKAAVSGENQSLSQVISLLPRENAERLQQLGPEGKVNIRYLDIDILSVKDKPLDLQYTGTIELNNAELSIPMEMAGEAGAAFAESPAQQVKWWNMGSPRGARDTRKGQFRVSEISGRLDIEDRGQRGMSGSFHFDKMRIINGLVTNVAGTIRRTGAMFYIEDLNGEMYGGRISAVISGATDLLFFSANVRAFGLSVARFANETGVTKERIWGDLRASVHINGERVEQNGKSTWRLSGMGSVNIDRANLGQTAIVKSIIDYRAFFVGDDATIESATLDFEIDPQRLLIDRLELRGPYVSTRAVGWINYRENLAVDLYFYRKRREGILPKIPVIDLAGRALGWAIDSIQNQLVVVHVTGTLTKPEISPAVLKDISEQFRRFIILNIREEETSVDEQ